MRAAILIAALALSAAPALAVELTDNQRRAECSVIEGMVSCPAPGVGRCWAEGHDPNLDQPALSLDLAGDPNAPDRGHVERCRGYSAPWPQGSALGPDALAIGKPALPPLPVSCRSDRCLIETVEATDVALADKTGLLVRALNQNWAFDPNRPAVKTREPDAVSYVFCSKSYPAVIEPIRAGEGAGKFSLGFLVPENGNFYNRSNALQMSEYFLVCHGRRFDALAADAPAFARAAGYAAILGDVQRVVDKPEDVLEYVY